MGVPRPAKDPHFPQAHRERIAAAEYGFELPYKARPNWSTYSALLALAVIVKRDLRDLKPRDMIDVQSFLWVQDSDEYA